MIAFALDYLLMAAAPTIAWLFVGRLIAGVTGAAYGPANAVLADITEPEKSGATFGLMGAAFGLGFILGPALGGLLAGFGTRAPFIAAAVLAAVNALWIAFALPETLPPERRRPFDWRQAHMFGAFKPLFHAGGAAPLLIAALLWQLGHFVYPSTWAFWAELALRWDATAIGWSLAAAGLAMGLAQIFVTGRAIARFGEARTVVIGMIVGGFASWLYVFAHDGWLVYTIIFLSALQGLVYPSINALLSRMTDASHQGALQGGMSSIAQHRRDLRAAGDDPGARLRRRERRAGRRVPARGLLVLCALLIFVRSGPPARSRGSGGTAGLEPHGRHTHSPLPMASRWPGMRSERGGRCCCSMACSRMPRRTG